jgi:AraC-like DNA-binding protein
MPTFETGLARGPIFLLERAEEMGFDRVELMAASGLAEDDLEDPDTRLPTGRFVALWKHVLELDPDPDLGTRIGSAMGVARMGLVGYLMMHSQDLEAALGRLARFSHILSEANRAVLVLRGDRGIFSWQPDPRLREISQTSDWILAALLAVGSEITGAELSPIEVHFPYPKPSGKRSYPSGVEGRQKWRRPRAALVLAREDLEREVADADPSLGFYLERYAETVLSSLASESPVSRKVREAIWIELKSGQPTLEKVAEDLYVSPRTLQRRLNEEGTSFSDLLEELRRSMATLLLHRNDLAIHEVAFLLGYSEPSAFYRAFRRWQQTSPQAFRAAAS